jgi:hypothetical protein
MRIEVSLLCKCYGNCRLNYKLDCLVLPSRLSNVYKYAGIAWAKTIDL